MKKFSVALIPTLVIVCLLSLWFLFANNNWHAEKITQLKTLFKNDVERDLEEEFHAVRNILIDPTCLLMLVTKGPSVCGTNTSIATTQKTQQNINFFQVCLFRRKCRREFFLFTIDKVKRAFPKFATTTVLSSQIIPTEKDHEKDIEIEMPRNVVSFLKEYAASRFLECHPTMTPADKRDRARKYNYKVEIHPRFAERIAQFIDVLAWFSITGFLFNGTLLGWRRECSIIPHTSDVDIAMFANQHSDAFIEALKSGSIPNFKLIQIYGKKEDSWEIQMVSDGVRIDLFYVYEEKKRNISYITGMRLEKKQQIKWLYPHFTEICASELHGQFVHLPCDVEKLLLAEYGKDWRIDHDTAYYSWDLSPKNTEEWRFLSDTEFEEMNQRFP